MIYTKKLTKYQEALLYQLANKNARRLSFMDKGSAGYVLKYSPKQTDKIKKPRMATIKKLVKIGRLIQEPVHNNIFKIRVPTIDEAMAHWQKLVLEAGAPWVPSKTTRLWEAIQRTIFLTEEDAMGEYGFSHSGDYGRRIAKERAEANKELLQAFMSLTGVRPHWVPNYCHYIVNRGKSWTPEGYWVYIAITRKDLNP